MTRPWVILSFALLFSLVSLPFVAGLTLNGDFTALLPESRPSVRDLVEIQDRFGRQATLTVLVKAKTSTDARGFIEKLANRIEARELSSVSAVDWNVSSFSQFVEQHRHIYAPLEDLEEVRDVLSDRLSYELGQANPLYVDLVDRDGAPPDPTEVLKRLESKAEEARSKMGRFPKGFFQHPELPLVVMFVRTSIKGGETNQIHQLLKTIQYEIDALEPATFGAGGLDVCFGGELMDIKEEAEALTSAVLWATCITVGLVLIAIYVFFMRVRAIPILGFALVPPLLMTFAIAEVAVDYLNASSAFLSSIVLGNGINPNVIWLARYFETRRSHKSMVDALAETHRSTWAATLTASLAAGLAYTSLVTTDFRGFRDFGIIGGTGMALCWGAAYLLLPAIVVLLERFAPTKSSKQSVRGVSYGRVFARLAVYSPGTVVFVSVLFSVLSVVAIYIAILANPMEYDFRNLQSQRSPDSRTQWVNDRQGEIVDETTTGSAIAILVDHPADVANIRTQLETYRSESSSVAFGAIRTIWDLLPSEQEDKLDVLDELNDILPKLAKHADDEERQLISDNDLSDSLVRLEPMDLPTDITRFFAENDGSLGKIVFVEHHPERNNWDGEYLVEWAKAVRSVRLNDGGRPAVAGQPPVFADLLEVIWVDGPRAVIAALCATVLLLMVTFRRWGERVHTLCALLLGILWMAALMALAGIKLNFLNFVAFPITFGNGVDYGVNLMRRYVEELQVHAGNRWAAVQAAIEGTGGAVVLCSLTTIIGYISLYTSTNRALNSFGAAMAISEVTCVFAGVLTLPALLIFLAPRRS